MPRNSVQHAALMTGKGLDYSIVITTDRPEPGGLSGSTIEETISWGKVKQKANKVMVDVEGGNNVMYLPLDRMTSQGSTGSGREAGVDSATLRELTNAVTEQLRRDAATTTRRGGR